MTADPATPAAREAAMRALLLTVANAALRGFTTLADRNALGEQIDAVEAPAAPSSGKLPHPLENADLRKGPTDEARPLAAAEWSDADVR